MISDLKADGLTYKALGARIGCAVSTVGDLATGRSREPVGMVAVKLMRLHENLVKRQLRAVQKAA